MEKEWKKELILFFFKEWEWELIPFLKVRIKNGN